MLSSLKTGEEVALSQKIFPGDPMAHREEEQTLRAITGGWWHRAGHTLLLSTGGA